MLLSARLIPIISLFAAFGSAAPVPSPPPSTIQPRDVHVEKVLGCESSFSITDDDMDALRSSLEYGSHYAGVWTAEAKGYLTFYGGNAQFQFINTSWKPQERLGSYLADMAQKIYDMHAESGTCGDEGIYISDSDYPTEYKLYSS
ncbi:MAG: hypothetical protein M1834_005060 [Cirrosporium novae-zelandiae]|nr:MAG: hypothetical protein M1834_005060 [Cirrosporium novae-zelandiae]